MPHMSREVLSGVAFEVFEALGEGVVVLDRDWCYRYVNPCGAELLGRTTRQLIGKVYLDVFPEARGTAFHLAYDRVLDSGVGEVLEEYFAELATTFRNRILPWSDGIVIFFSDVSERKRREAALLEELDVLTQVVQHAEAAVVLLDLDGRCLLLNKAAAGFLQMDAEQVLGRTADQLLPVEFATEVMTRLSSVRLTREAIELEPVVQLVPGGPSLEFSTVLFPTYDVEGELAGMGVIAHDITQRRSSERALAAGERRFRTVFEQTSLGQLLIEVGGHIVDGNEAFCDLVGYSVEELRLLDPKELLGSGAEVADKNRRMRAQGVFGYDADDVLTCKDGTRVPVLRSVTLFDDPQSGRPMASTIVRDLTEVRRLEAERTAAREMLLRFQSLVEGSGDFIAMGDMDRNVTYVNPAGRRLVGLAPDAPLIGMRIADFLTPTGRVLSLERELPAVLAHGSWQGESTLRDHRGGLPIPTAVSSFLMRHAETGEPLALATVQRDLRERHLALADLAAANAQRAALLERLVLAQELERAQIAADVHDDSVQALAAADLRVGLLRRHVQQFAPDCVPLAETAQKSIAGAAERLRHLLFDLESPDPSVPLGSALLSLAAHVFEDSPVRWVLVSDEADLPYAERVTALRIAKEALINVRKHSRARLVTISLSRSGSGVEVLLTDDGMAPDAGAITSSEGHRGLATMRDRAEVAGGTWSLENGPAKGLAVRFWLPGDVLQAQAPPVDGSS